MTASSSSGALATAPPPRSGHSRAARPLLDRDVWLAAAADAVAEGGFTQLRILILAKKLGVTRGSFYWHFRDHADFVRAFLDRWLAFRARRTSAWARRVEGQDAESALLNSLDALFDVGRSSPRNIRIELAIRDYALRDAYAAEVLARSDEMRYALSVDLYSQLTGDPERARRLAVMLYLVVAGSDLVLQSPTRDETLVAGIKTLVAELLVTGQKSGVADREGDASPDEDDARHGRDMII